jgi:hypothetical protein
MYNIMEEETEEEEVWEDRGRYRNFFVRQRIYSQNI